MSDPRSLVAPRISSNINGENWYRIFAKRGENDATIELYDQIDIWGTPTKSIVSELKDLDVETIQLHVNSPGGDAWDG